MTNKRGTKHALLMSALALLLCVSMLVGSTYAWFTDSVTSTGNIIKSGTLEVTMEWKDATATGNQQTYLDASEGAIFNYDKWEPGYVEAKNVKIANVGTLALKYQLSIIANGAVSEVANVIDVYYADGEYTLANREMSELKYIGTLTEVLAGMATTASGNLEAGTNHTVTLALKMQESADNKYQDKSIGSTFTVQLVATQLTAEEDSFDNEYDAGAWVETMPVSTEAELMTALSAGIGENVLVSLINDITLSEEWTPIGDKDKGEYFIGTLDGNGYTISGLNVTANDYDALISAAKDATIKNLTVEGIVNGVNAAGIVARVEGNTVIANCTSNVTVKGTTKAGGIVCNVTGADAKIINCVNNADISGGDSGIGGIVGYVNNDAYLALINCVNNGSVTSDNNKYAGAAVGYTAKSKGVVAGFNNTGTIIGTIINDGRYLKDGETVLCGYVGEIGNWIVAEAIDTADKLVAAFANLTAGDALYIVADLDMTGKTLAPVTGNKGFAMYGNGYTISNLNTTAAALFVGRSGSSAYTFDGVVLENCSVNSSTNYGALFVGDGDTSDAITITNCVVKNCTVNSAKYAAAFVGYTAGYNVQNNGPVYSDVLIENCSVIGGSITGGGSTGAAVGHAGGNVDTTTIISNVKVDGVAINGENAERTGIIVGTANVGKTTINNATYKNVTGNYNGLYGRFVPGTTGSLVIDGASVLNGTLSDAITAGATELYLPAGTYTIPATVKGKTLTITGTKDTKIDVSAGLTYINGSNVTFDGVTIKSKPGTGYNYGFADANYTVFNNCVIEGSLGLDYSCEFNNCVFNITGNNYNIWTWGAGTAIFNGCTFNCDGKAMLVYANALDNGTYHQTVKINDCIFNDNGDDTVTGKAAIEITNTYTPVRTYDVIINNTTVNGFAQTVPGTGDFNAAYGSVEGSDIGTNVWGNKCKLPNTQINVEIDGVDVY